VPRLARGSQAQMRKAGLVGRTPRRFRRTTIADPSTQVQVQDLVQREFDPTEPNQLWFSDITYIRTWEGWPYLAIVLDAYSRKVVTAALQMAPANRKPTPGFVCHSDRGSQYTSAGYRDLLEEHGLRCSVGQPGTCWDNAVADGATPVDSDQVSRGLAGKAELVSASSDVNASDMQRVDLRATLNPDRVCSGSSGSKARGCASPP
jgi:hypothetical protein